jgi:hypothetical protein
MLIIDPDEGLKIVLHAAVIIGPLGITGAINSGRKGCGSHIMAHYWSRREPRQRSRYSVVTHKTIITILEGGRNDHKKSD